MMESPNHFKALTVCLAVVTLARLSVCTSPSGVDVSAIHELRWDLSQVLDTDFCQGAFREAVTEPSEDLTSSLHLAVEISRLYDIFNRRVVRELTGEYTRQNAAKCMFKVSKVLLDHRVVASQLEYRVNTGYNLQTLWNEVFVVAGQEYVFRYMGRRQQPSMLGSSIGAALGFVQSFGSRDRMSTTYTRRTLAWSSAGKKIVTDLQYHLFGYLAMNLVISVPEDLRAFCSSLGSVNTFITRLQVNELVANSEAPIGTTLFDTLLEVCPGFVAVDTYQRSILHVINTSGSNEERDQAIGRFVHLMSKLDKVDVGTFERLWTKAVSCYATAGGAYETALTALVVTTLSDASLDRVAVLSWILAAKNWSAPIPLDLAKYWEPVTDDDKESYAVIYLSLFPLSSHGPEEMETYCRTAGQLRTIFGDSRNDLFESFWETLDEDILIRWCPVDVHIRLEIAFDASSDDIEIETYRSDVLASLFSRKAHSGHVPR